MKSVTIKHSKKGKDELDNLLANLDIEDAEYDAGVKNPVDAEKGYLNEFGIDAPARPLLRTTFSEYDREVNTRYRVYQAVNILKKDKPISKLVKDIAFDFIKAVKTNIDVKRFGSNAESTIRDKGFDLPFVDTGDFYESLNAWKIK